MNGGKTINTNKKFSMRKISKYTFVFIVVAVLFMACKKNDYFIGGTLHNSKVNMSTYDYLKSNAHGLFDTLLLLVDKAGLKDKINQQGTTFFAPTDYSINNYLLARSKEEQNIDPARVWTIDSVFAYEMDKMTDSLNIYLTNSTLTYDKLTEDGTIYETQKTGAQAVVSYEKTLDPNLGYNPNVNTVPQIVWYTFLWEPLTPPFKAQDITTDQGTRERVQTSGIETTNGIIHVLNNDHKLLFRK